MLSSSLHTLLKLSKTTSPNKLFDNDCVTLYADFPFSFLYYKNIQDMMQSDRNIFSGMSSYIN